MGKKKKFLKPEDILSHKVGSMCRFTVKTDGVFYPPVLPESGDRVQITNQYPPQGKELAIVRKDWRLSAPLYLMSQVVFESYGVEYTFQIRPTDTHGVGELILITTRTLEFFPGSATRTKRSSNSKLS